MHEELKNYIKNMRHLGYDDDFILYQLKKAGWTAEALKLALKGAPRISEQKEFAITVNNISKSFGKINALNGVMLNVKKGNILGLLGKNGAGKTTLIRILTTLLGPDSGSAKVLDFDIEKDAQKVRESIGLAGQYAAVDENLTGFENLEMVGRLYHLNKKEARARAVELLNRFSLYDARSRKLKTYSGGMRRRLDLAASLVNKPKLLFLDEPTNGLDPQSRIELWEILQNLVSDGTTLFLTTQYLEEADHLSDSIAVIHNGKIIAEGTPNSLKQKVGGDVIEVHLSNATQIFETASLLRPIVQGKAKFDESLGQITIPVIHGVKSLTQVIRALDIENIQIEDIFLRRPTLDEAFLTLTKD